MSSTSVPMAEVIHVINELHDVLSELNMEVALDLPQIAVIGSQSSGKSSVLESIVGRDFLPRGSGIVTRCPLVLQLHQEPEGSSEWGEFLHKPKENFTDFKQIMKEIEKRTEALTTGVAGGVTDKPITLKVHSPNVLTLTLVDLPGLVMNAVGDQPKDIDKQIKEMVTNYVRPSNTIMLAVTPANADIATSVALRLAKQLDPHGERTLGVLTKLDLMDRGVDAVEMLEGRQVPLKLGYIGVVNRSQADINEDKSMEAARASEKEFFLSHPSYRNIAERHGTDYLCKTLNKLLLSHIQQQLPKLKAHVDKLMYVTRKEQEALGMLEDYQTEPAAQLLSLIKKFSDNISMCIEGESIEGAKELVGGARIDYIFHECFAPFVQSISPAKDLTNDHIRLTIRNRCGMQSTLFPSDQVFITLVKQQIKRLEDPSVKCVNFIFDELKKIVEQCSVKAQRYPKLKTKFVDIALTLLRKYLTPTVSHVRMMIAAECGYINLKHPHMQNIASNVLGNDGEIHEDPAAAAGGAGGLHNGAAGGPSASSIDIPRNIHLGQNMTAHETRQNSLIRKMVEAYFDLCKMTITDQIPKIITLLMIHQLVEDLYPTLITELYHEKMYGELLEESADLAAKRRATQNMMTCLQRAQKVLNKVRG